MTITIISKTVDYRERVEGGVDQYRTIPGAVTRHNVKGMTNPLLFDGLLDAQNEWGQIVWVKVTETFAYGTTYNHEHGGHDRIAVIDADNASVTEGIDAVEWLRGADANS